ncbi:metallophosphoesterase family protein [Pararhizobium mangrovi]|uniref:Phosphoesterase n=1 Tax=Pararhizobium mangrovi TaxID=2590452 RepID=A0A506U5D9_9HYPH|nr:metallophosphoesterase family protein [Pararhizobium mangrovi]TPW29592.1 metallophosphoesterase family protein [Pararhizobium mangrovi]
MKLGIISDTHGLLRPEAEAALSGCDHIVHAGDIGDPEIIERLRAIAPVSAIVGNVDTAPWADAFPATLDIELASRRIHVLHSIDDLDRDPEAEGIDVVVYGHSHKPGYERRGDVLFLNPGSAGPRRFSLPATLAQLDLGTDDADPTILSILKD